MRRPSDPPSARRHRRTAPSIREDTLRPIPSRSHQTSSSKGEDDPVHHDNSVSEPGWVRRGSYLAPIVEAAAAILLGIADILERNVGLWLGVAGAVCLAGSAAALIWRRERWADVISAGALFLFATAAIGYFPTPWLGVTGQIVVAALTCVFFVTYVALVLLNKL